MIRVFPHRNKWIPTDELAFVGSPPLFLPPEQPVKISVTFTWDIPMGKRLAQEWKNYYSDVQIGGPAFDDPGNGFDPGIFIKEGVTFTSRGCPQNCPWCFVPGREGNIRELPIKPGWIIQDNNLLACSDKHIEAVCDMLFRQRKAAVFAGGLDSKIFSKKHIRMFGELRIKEMWFSWDSKDGYENIKKVADLLSWVEPYRKRLYVLVGFDGDLPEKAIWRLKESYQMGFFPFAMYFRPLSDNRFIVPSEWRNLIRTWTRPAAYNALMRPPAGGRGSG